MLPLSLRTIIAKVGKDLYIDQNGIILTSLVHFNHISLLGFTFFQGKGGNMIAQNKVGIQIYIMSKICPK